MSQGFSITYNGVELDVEENSQLTVEWYSTVFNESELFRGSYSYPVQLMWTEKNLIALEFANQIENRLARTDIQVSISLFGQNWKNATLSVDMEYNRLPAVLLIDNAIISQVISEKTLSDLFVKVDGLKRIAEPMLVGVGRASTLAKMKESAENPYILPYAFPQYTNFSIWGEREINDSAIVNRYLSPYSADGSAEQYDLSDGRLINPMFYLTWLIQEVCRRIGFEAEGSFLRDPEVRTWLIYNTGYYTSKEVAASPFNIYPARHFPKLSISALFKLLRNDLGLFIYFDSLTKRARFELPDEILSNPSSLDFSEWIIDRTTKVRGMKDKAFLFKMGVDEGDDTYNFLPYTQSKRIGLPGDHKPVDITISAPRMNNGIFSGHIPLPFRQVQVSQLANVYSIEYVQSSAYNKEGEISKNDFTLRFISFRGLKSTGQMLYDRFIPYGTSDNRNAIGQIEVDWMSTNLDSPNNWLDRISSIFYRMMTLTESVEFDARIPIDQWSQVNPLQVGKLALQNQVRTAFLPDRITFEPSMRNSEIFTKVRGYLYHKIYGLMNPADMMPSDYDRLTPPEHIYIAWRYIDRREVRDRNGNLLEVYAKPELMFFDDPFATLAKRVKAFDLEFDQVRHLPTGDLPVRTSVRIQQDRINYIGAEFLISYYISGQFFNTSVRVISDELNTYSGI